MFSSLVIQEWLRRDLVIINSSPTRVLDLHVPADLPEMGLYKIGAP